MIIFWGFNNYDPADVGIGFTMNSSATSGSNRSSSIKRTGTHSMRVISSSSVYQNYVLPATYATIYVGFAVYLTALPAARYRLVSLNSGTSRHLTLTVESNGSLRLWRGLAGGFDGIAGATSLGQTAAGVFAINSWQHIQIKGTIHSSAGVFEVRLNSVALAALTGSSANTQTGGNAYVDRFDPGDIGSGIECYYDDMWVADSGFQGDCAVEGMTVSADGTTNNFTASTGSRFQCVDETAQKNDDTDYVSSSTLNDIQLFTLTDLVATTGTVKGWKVWGALRKDDAGARSAALVVRSGSSNSVRSDIALTTTYTYYWETFILDPTDSAALSISKSNALEVGCKVTS